MKKLIEELKTNPNITEMYATDDQKIILVENKSEAVFVINAKTFSDGNGNYETYGYQWTMPIKPNLRTGSSLTGSGDYFDYVSLEEMLKVATTWEKFIPNFFSQNKRETVKIKWVKNISLWRKRRRPS